MKFVRRLYEQFEAYHAHGRPNVQYTGMVGIAAFPVFYLLRFTKAEAPYNDLWLRALAVLVCVGLATRRYWPRRLQPYYLMYGYAALLYCLPFFFIFTSLANGGGVVAVANTLMAVFFLILLSDWRNSVLMLLVSMGAAAALFRVLMPGTPFPMDYVARLPIVALVVVGGSLFKFAEKQATAEKIKRTYSALAGSIAHEMRHPLGQIRHNLEQIEQALPRPGSGQVPDAHAVDTLYRHVAESELAVTRGLQLIQMTLDQVSERPLDPSSFALLSAAEVVHKAVREFSHDPPEARDRVHVELVEDFSFRGDETAYMFVLFNLVRNALYYLPVRPALQVTIYVGPGHTVSVHDTGPGIGAQAREKLFEPFRSRGKSGGTGLGLAYCRRVMQNFGGEIDCESVPGAYTRFTMVFPPVFPQEVEAHRLDVLERARRVFAGKRLLLVEDDAAQRLTTRHKLRALEAPIDEAADGQRALELLERNPYAMILMDLNMPVRDGYSVARLVREGSGPNRDSVIVAYTSEPAHVASVKTARAGMDGFVSKPCAQVPLVLAMLGAMQGPRTRAAGAPLTGMRVLLADDSTVNRRASAGHLLAAGAQVAEAAHGAAVLDMLANAGPFDVVLLDLQMPGMDGIQAARAIRGSGMAWAQVPLVALTAHLSESARIETEALQFTRVLTKPVDAVQLVNTLRRFGRRDKAAASLLPLPPAPAPQDGPLLNTSRLEGYARLGMLDELLADYLPELARLSLQLQDAVALKDIERCLTCLHSLLGMSGEAGAHALHQMLRGLYVPMIEERRWPGDPNWAARVRTLADATADALREYAVRHHVAPPGQETQ